MNHRGMDGFLSLGGVLVASAGPLVNGALIAGATQLDLDGTALAGVVATGDTFTIAGEAGAPVHTVTGGPYVAVASAIEDLTFTPGIAAGGVPDNAAITFASNAVGEARMWNLSAAVAPIDTTTLGKKWATNRPGLASWSGSGEAFLDKDDPRQSSLIDKIIAGTPVGDINTVLFGVASKKQWYAAAVLSGLAINGAQVGSIITVAFTFTGSGALLPNWS